MRITVVTQNNKHIPNTKKYCHRGKKNKIKCSFLRIYPETYHMEAHCILFDTILHTTRKCTISKCDKCLKLHKDDRQFYLNKNDKYIKINEKKFSNCPHKNNCDLIDGADARRFIKNMIDPKKIEKAKEAERILQQKMNELAKQPVDPKIIEKLRKMHTEQQN